MESSLQLTYLEICLRTSNEEESDGPPQDNNEEGNLYPTIGSEVMVDKLAQGLRDTAYDSMFIRHNVSIAAASELRIINVEYVKAMLKKRDANYAYYYLIQVSRLGSSANFRTDFDTRILEGSCYLPASVQGANSRWEEDGACSR